MDNKNDGAHVEQKNWARVRELVGYYRYDTPPSSPSSTRYGRWTRCSPTTSSPQQKLILKQPNGAKVTRRHDTATTPHQRAIAHQRMRKRPIITRNATFNRLKPAALSRQILALTRQLEVLAQAKKAPRTKPPINHAWKRHRLAEDLK